MINLYEYVLVNKKNYYLCFSVLIISFFKFIKIVFKSVSILNFKCSSVYFC